MQILETQINEDSKNNFENELLHDDFIRRWALDDVADSLDYDNPYHYFLHGDDFRHDGPHWHINNMHMVMMFHMVIVLHMIVQFFINLLDDSTEEVTHKGDTCYDQTFLAM